MEYIKNIAKKLLRDNRILNRMFLYYRYSRSFGLFRTLIYFIKDIFVRFYPKKKNNQAQNVSLMLSKIRFKESKNNYFFYNIDTHKIFYSKKKYLENFTVDYDVILKNGINDLKTNKKDQYHLNKNIVIDGINKYIDNIINYIESSNFENKDLMINWFSSMKNNKAIHFDEALQRILFYNQIMWQTGHVLVGLGRLDTILIDYYENDIKNKYITKEKASLMINDFMRILHEFYWLKSNSLLGDTGQIIILGGKNEKNQYIANDLTYMFIEELKKIHFPDPKVLLRVSEDIPKQLLQESIDCIKTGIGSPLFANDDVIIPLLIKFGYDKKDAYNYATSACWEPLIPGRAAEQNNLNSFVFMNPFNKMLDNEDLNKISSIDELLKIYEKYIDKYVKNMVDNINLQQYEYEPYVSLFIENCDTECKDITEFYGKYNYWGLTTVSLGNVVNSIINIDKLVFKNHDYTFSEFNELRKNNFGNDESIISNLKQTDIRYGLDDKNVLDLSNKVMNYMSESVLKYKIHGGKIKIGYSAPSYISHSLDQFASFDGRKDKDPFIVHISSDINGLPYTSLFNFASKLDYSENRFNGNVIDFIVNPSFLDNNNDKFIDFLLLSIKNSFFEMQMNVISSKILIEAKKNPKLHPDLIVRVWGFSAYFNDLPENYKDVLIKRTLESENQYGK